MYHMGCATCENSNQFSHLSIPKTSDLPGALRIARDPVILQADGKGSDQTARISMLQGAHANIYIVNILFTEHNAAWNS